MDPLLGVILPEPIRFSGCDSLGMSLKISRSPFTQITSRVIEWLKWGTGRDIL